MGKRILALMLAITAAVSGMALPAQAAQEVPENSAVSMILVHGESGTVLAEKNADSRCLIASTTKIMTALTALELAEPEDTVIIDPAWTAVEGSSMYLQAGETYTLRELLYGLLLASGNDGAVAVAHLAAGDEGAFVERMNEKARALGLTNTHFENPHGLDGQEHYSTARDLAVIMAAAMENETFREITAAQSATVHGQTYSNHNRLLGECAGVNGGKTGYTKAAGRCLVSTCSRDGLELICVTLSDPDDWQDHAALYDWAYGEYRCVRYPAGTVLAQVPVVSGADTQAGAALQEEVSLCLPVGTEAEPELALPRFVFAAVAQGGPAGTVRFPGTGAPGREYPLVWAQNVARMTVLWRAFPVCPERRAVDIYCV